MNFLVLIEPMKEDADGPLFVGATAQSNKVGPLRASEMIPRVWGGIFQRRIIPAYEVTWMKEEPLARQGISHLALLTGDCGEADPFFFGREPVNGSSLMCWYSQDTGLYHFVHCAECCNMLIGWLGHMQETWSANDSGPKKDTRTLN